MAKSCNKCTGENSSKVPYVVFEGAMSRAERQIKNLVLVIVLLILLLVGSNIGWLVYESQFEDVTTTEEIIVDSEDNGIANYIGDDGEIYNGEDSSNKN